MRTNGAALTTIDIRGLELVARRLKALADASRLSVIRALCGGERRVGEIVDETGLAQANVSKHLRVLRDQDLVRTRRDGRSVVYRLSSRLPEDVCAIICGSIDGRAPSRNAGRARARGYERKAG